MSDSQGTPVASHTRRIGCLLLSLAWLLMSSSMYVVLTILNFAVVNINPSGENIVAYPLEILYIALECIFLIVSPLGFIFSLAWGLGSGPRKWPKFYRWIENHLVLRSMETGSVAGVVTAVGALGVTISSHLNQLPVYGVVLILAGYLILILAAFVAGSIVGAAGGILAGSIAKRFSDNIVSLYIAGAFGGTIAGLCIGVLPNALGWLTP